MRAIFLISDSLKELVILRSNDSFPYYFENAYYCVEAIKCRLTQAPRL